MLNQVQHDVEMKRVLYFDYGLWIVLTLVGLIHARQSPSLLGDCIPETRGKIGPELLHWNDDWKVRQVASAGRYLRPKINQGLPLSRVVLLSSFR